MLPSPFRVVSVVASLLSALCPLVAQSPGKALTDNVFGYRSELLSAFWGRDMFVRAAVAVPADRKPGEQLPVCFNIHGFGGNLQSCSRRATEMLATMATGTSPRMCYAFLEAQYSLGHHEFACRLLAADLQQLGSDAQIVFAEGRNHGDLLRPHAELWPDGLLARIHREMRARFDAARTK